MRYGLSICLGLLALAGCAGPGSNASKALKEAGEDARLAVTRPHTPLYKFGPAQASGPDISLAKDDIVTLVQVGSGFSRVRTESGEIGYVPNDRLAPAPPEMLGLMRVDGPREQMEMVSLEELLRDTPEPALPTVGSASGASGNLSAPSAPAQNPPALRVSDPNLSSPVSHGQNDHQ